MNFSQLWLWLRSPGSVVKNHENTNFYGHSISNKNKEMIPYKIKYYNQIKLQNDTKYSVFAYIISFFGSIKQRCKINTNL